MKNIFFLFVLLNLISCAHQGDVKNRSYASGAHCVIEKHEFKDHFRLRIKDKLYNNYWYDEPYAKQLLENLHKSGKC